MIHFNEEASLGGQNYYDFFPQELLEGSPYKIRVIEHEDFIDYEIEFVEMRDEDGEKEEDEYQYEYYNEEEPFNPIESPADTGLTSGWISINLAADKGGHFPMQILFLLQ